MKHLKTYQEINEEKIKGLPRLLQTVKHDKYLLKNLPKIK